MLAKIKECRLKSGVTLAELSKETGISPGELSRIENGKRNVTLCTLQKICGPLGLRVKIVEI